MYMMLNNLLVCFLDIIIIWLFLLENLFVIVGGMVGVCVFVIIGIVLVLFVIWYV